MIRIRYNSDDYVSVEEKVAKSSSVIANLLEDIDTTEIQLPDCYRYPIRLEDIQRAFDYAERYLEKPVPTRFPFYDLWEEQWAASMDRADLLLLCCFAEFIGLERLHVVLSHIIADYDSDFSMAWRRDHPCPFYTNAEAAQQWGAKDYYKQKLARYKWWNRECEINFDKASARQEYIALQGKRS